MPRVLSELCVAVKVRVGVSPAEEEGPAVPDPVLTSLVTELGTFGIFKTFSIIKNFFLHFLSS